MRNELYDITNELGSQNWLDVTAGEAVLLGQFTFDPELVMLGTLLARGVRNVNYNKDDFSKVEAQAMGLVGIIKKKKEELTSTVFLDEICEYKGGEKLSSTWEYNLLLSGGRYQVLMMMPEYIGTLSVSGAALEIEKTIQNSFYYPRFEQLKMVKNSKIVGDQKLDTADYYTNQNSLVCHSVDFDHEGGWKRGKTVIYYINDSNQAMETWAKIRSISSRKK